MNGPKASPERERHPTIETFERVLNNGIIVDRSSYEPRPDARVDAMKSIDAIDIGSKGATHPIFLGETWKDRP